MSLSNIAGEAAGNAVIKSVIYGELKENKNGELYTRYVGFVRRFLFGLVIFMLVVSVLLQVMPILLDSPNSASDQKLINGLCIICVVVSVMSLIRFKKMFFYKYTITKNGLQIKGVTKTENINFENLKMGLEKYPLIRYGANVILMTDDNVMIKFDFTGIHASILFLETLSERIGEPAPNSKYLRSIVRNSLGMRTTKEEKAGYKERKATASYVL